MAYRRLIDKPAANFLWDEKLEAKVVATFDEVVEVLRSRDFSAVIAQEREPSMVPLADPNAAKTQLIDGIRNGIDAFRSLLRNAVAHRFESLSLKGSIDVQREIILPSCQEIALQSCGIEASQNAAECLELASDVFMLTDGKEKESADRATIELSKMFVALIQKKKSNSNTDILSEIISSDVTIGELVSPVIQLFVSLSNSLPLLIGNIVHDLFLFPDQRDIFQTESNEAKSARMVAELIRYCGPLQFVYRTANKPTTVGVHGFQTGERVALFLSRANLHTD